MKNSLDSHQPLHAKIEVLPVDFTDGSEVLQVPIFVDLIVPSQSSNGRDCIVSAETFPDVTDGTPEEEARLQSKLLYSKQAQRTRQALYYYHKYPN